VALRVLLQLDPVAAQQVAFLEPAERG